MAKILRDKCFYYLSDTSVEASEKLAEELLKYYQPNQITEVTLNGNR